jgi:hypothetical protein
MPINRQAAENADMRQRARQCLDRAKAQALNPSSFRYACLELRFCIEFLVIGRLQAYLDEVGDEALRKWTPKDIINEILTVDPHGDKSVSVSLGIHLPSGLPIGELKPLGEDRRFNMKWANKSYNTLGNFLHAPTLEQLEAGKDPEVTVVEKRVGAIIEELDAVLASPIYNVNFGNFFQLKCECCGTDIKRRADSIPKSGVMCPNRACRAIYDVKKIESGFSYVIKTVHWYCTCGHGIYFPHNRPGLLNSVFDCQGCGKTFQIILTARALTDPGEAVPPEALLL